MGNLASLTFMLGANVKSFQTSMRKATATLETVGKNMKKVGGQMSMYLTAPIAALGAASLAAYDKQAQAEQKLAAQLRANGKDVAATMAQYKAFASGLQEITTVGDETTLGLMQMAETMGSIDTQGAVQGAIGLSKALGVDLQTATKMVVLAQQGEYTMLNRYVPALRTASSETAKAAIVQKLLADGFEVAKAEAQTGLGPLKQLQNTIGDLSESFGAIVADAIKPAVEWLKKAAEKFNTLSDKGKQTIAIVAGIAAAIGPLIAILGGAAMALSALVPIIAALTGPIGLVVLAVAAVAAAVLYVYGNFQAFKDRFTDWDWLKNALIDVAVFIAKTLTMLWRPILDAFGMDFITPAIEKLETFKTAITKPKTEFKSFGQTVKDVAKEAMGALGMFSTNAKKDLESVSVGMNNVSTHAGKMANSIQELSGRNIDVTPNLIINQKRMQANMQKTIPVVDQYLDTMQQSWSSTVGNIQMMLAQSMTDLAVSLGEALANMISGVDQNFGNQVLKIVGTFIKNLGSALIAYGAMMLAFSILQKTAGSNPVSAILAIAIGIAAVVAGQLIMNMSADGFSGQQMAKGGIVPPGFGGDTYPALLSTGETVLPSPIPLGALGGAQELNVNVRGQLRGKDLLILSDSAKADRSRVRGY